MVDIREKTIELILFLFPELRHKYRSEKIEEELEKLQNKHENPKIIFHGGCLGCSMQRKKGVIYCKGCKYFDLKALSNLPSLNDKDVTRSKLIEEYKSIT